MTQLDVSADSGAYLNSGYWGSFTIGRFLGIFVSLYFTPQQMVLADLLGCIVAVVVIMCFQSSFTALWLGTVIYGVSVGSVYASAINYTERLVGVSGRLLSYLTFFAALGDAVVPLSIGTVFDTSIGGRGMMWVVVLVAATATSTFAYLCWWVERSQARISTTSQQYSKHREEGGSEEAGRGRIDQPLDSGQSIEVTVVQPAARLRGDGGSRSDSDDGQLDSSWSVEQRHQRLATNSDGVAVRAGAGKKRRVGYAQLLSQPPERDGAGGCDVAGADDAAQLS